MLRPTPSALGELLRAMPEPELLLVLDSLGEPDLRLLHAACFPDCRCSLKLLPCAACEHLRALIPRVLAEAGRDWFDVREVLDHVSVHYHVVQRALRRLTSARLLVRQGGRYRHVRGSVELVRRRLARRWKCDCPPRLAPCKCGVAPALDLPDAALQRLLSRLDDYTEPPSPVYPDGAYSRPALARLYAGRAHERRGLRHTLDLIQQLNRSKLTAARLSISVNTSRNGAVQVRDLREG